MALCCGESFCAEHVRLKQLPFSFARSGLNAMFSNPASSLTLKEQHGKRQAGARYGGLARSLSQPSNWLRASFAEKFILSMENRPGRFFWKRETRSPNKSGETTQQKEGNQTHPEQAGNHIPSKEAKQNPPARGQQNSSGKWDKTSSLATG